MERDHQCPPPRETSTNPWHIVICVCWCSWTSALLYVVLIFKGGIVMMGVCLHRFCLNIGIVCSELGQGMTGCVVSVWCTVSGMVLVTLLCCRLWYMMVWMCFILSSFWRRLWCWSLFPCMWCSLYWCMLFVSVCVVLWCNVVGVWGVVIFAYLWCVSLEVFL